MANFITVLRILLSVGLLFCPALSLPFYGLYLLAGVSDMIDGPVARKTNTVSEFGTKLDSIADLVLVAVCLYKLAPVLDIPPWLYVWTAGIALIKAVNLASGYVVQKRFVTLHTAMNKATGALLFLLPLTVSVVDLKYTSIPVCGVATFAAVQEGHFIRTGQAVSPS